MKRGSRMKGKTVIKCTYMINQARGCFILWDGTFGRSQSDAPRSVVFHTCFLHIFLQI